MRYTGPRNRLARREGIDLGLKTPGSKAQASLLKKINIVPGQHGRSRRSKTTDYGYQLREKQKVKRMYGLNEKQLKRYFDRANVAKGNTADNLIHSIEKRLDNVLYRLNFAPTRASARQLVSHGHVAVNSKKVTIPSFQIKEQDEIMFPKVKTSKIPYVDAALERKDIQIPNWLVRDKKVGKMIEAPTLEDFKEDINLQAVVEFYSR